MRRRLFLSYYRAVNTSHRNTVHVLEVGFGNLPSLRRVLSQMGVSVTPIDSASELLSVRHLIIPGVGSFQTAMQHLKQNGFIESLKERCLKRKLPTLGICLGAQILLEEGHEGGISRGIGVFAGTVERSDIHLSTPESHTGWDTVEIYVNGFSTSMPEDVPGVSSKKHLRRAPSESNFLDAEDLFLGCPVRHHAHQHQRSLHLA